MAKDFLLGFIISRFTESNYGNDDRNDVKAFAQNSANGKIIEVIDQPKRRYDSELCVTDGFAVTRPHSKCAACLCNKDKQSDPPNLRKDQNGHNRCCDKSRFD